MVAAAAASSELGVDKGLGVMSNLGSNYIEFRPGYLECYIESVILLQVLPKYIMRNCYSLWPRILTKLDRTNKVATQSRNVFQSMPCPNSPGTPACRIHAHQNVGSPSAGGEDKTNI